MNLDVQNRGAIATARCERVVDIERVTGERLAVDIQRLPLDDMLFAETVVRLVNTQVQRYRTVATVSGGRCVGVNTRLSELLSVEGVEVIIYTTDTVVDNSVNRFVDNQLQAVEHALAVDEGRVVAVDTGGVEVFLLTVPLVDPLIWQIV